VPTDFQIRAIFYEVPSQKLLEDVLGLCYSKFPAFGFNWKENLKQVKDFWSNLNIS
jgi:hypothetical protein